MRFSILADYSDFGYTVSEPRDPEAVNAAGRVVLDQLAWWARALKAAREVPPYARKVAV